MSAESAPGDSAARRTVYRWDLDKTYLSTDFDSLRGLLRTAIEKAVDKRTFPGARTLLRELCATQPRGLYILSGSPEQMRSVLEEKLRLDGITWDGLVLKPSLNRLLRGRFRFLRDQVSYKLSALLASRAEIAAPYAELMFGDDAEADAFVYSLYADLCAGRVGLDVLSRVLELTRAYDDDAADLLELARAVPRGEVVRRMFIHLERVEPSQAFSAFGARVCAFHNYFQPCLVLLQDGLLSTEAVVRIGVELSRDHSFSPEALGASYTDLCRRGLLSGETGERLAEAVQLALPDRGAAREALQVLLREIATSPAPGRALEPVQQEPLDYVALFPSDRARAVRAKSRARSRGFR